MLQARPVQGLYRRLRRWANAGLIAVLFAIPWIEPGGVPILRLDVPARQLHAFGLVFFPQELLFLWMIVLGLVLSLFFFTALAGRLWCGWACPQTVFTDVFAGIARRVEGWRGTRRPAHVARWRVVVTHAVWAALSVAIGFHLVAYFRSPYALLTLDAGPAALGVLAFAGALAYVDFVWVRQAFCKSLCPYARFQGVLFDRDTLVIGYDTRRGEPRGKRGTTAGDCVDCDLCVAVCPSAIDIRDGLQLECIACTQCIDACDGVMDKLGRARGLIDYRSLVSLEGIRSVRLLRPRVVLYGLALVGLAGLFVQQLAQRVPFDLQVARNRASLYQRMPDGRIGNAYTLLIQNRGRTPREFRIELSAPAPFELVTGTNPVTVGPTRTLEARVFVVSAPDAGATVPQPIHFALGDGRIVRESTFVFPQASGGAPDGS